ncbi:MAG: hypothetical protein ACK6AT_01190 [Planctomycetota bacterium]
MRRCDRSILRWQRYAGGKRDSIADLSLSDSCRLNPKSTAVLLRKFENAEEKQTRQLMPTFDDNAIARVNISLDDFDKGS